MPLIDWIRRRLASSPEQQANPMAQIGMQSEQESPEDADFSQFGSTLPGLALGEQKIAYRPVGKHGVVSDIADVSPSGDVRTATGAGDPQALRGAFNRLMMQEAVRRGTQPSAVPTQAVAPQQANMEAIPPELRAVELQGAGGPGGPSGAVQEGEAEPSPTWPEQGILDYNSSAERESAAALRAGTFPYAGLATGRVRNVDVSRAARSLGMDRADFVRKAKESGITAPAFAQGFIQRINRNREMLRGQVPDQQLDQAAMAAAEEELKQAETARREAAEESRFKRQQELQREMEGGRMGRFSEGMTTKKSKQRFDEELKLAELEISKAKLENDEVGIVLAEAKFRALYDYQQERLGVSKASEARRAEEAKTKAAERGVSKSEKAEKAEETKEEKVKKSEKEEEETVYALRVRLAAAAEDIFDSTDPVVRKIARNTYDFLKGLLEDEHGVVGLPSSDEIED